ncbi:MAG: hypothetical protein P9L96_01700 [Candidatus Gygaella obscura]|nr:hypothetical protein [Candidatus Gygaella obscura]
MKRIFRIILIIVFLFGYLLPGYVAGYDIEITSYYPSPDGDFKILKAEEIHGGDDTYKDASDKLQNADSGAEIEEKVLGLNADYVDGYSSSDFLMNPIENHFLGLIISFGVSNLLTDFVVTCGTHSWLKGMLVFNTPLQISVCDLLLLLPGVGVALAGVCNSLGLNVVSIGIGGLAWCTGLESLNPSNPFCEHDGFLSETYIACKDNYETGLPFCWCDFKVLKEAFEICGWEDPCSNSCAYCNSCINNGLSGLFCCNSLFKTECENKCPSAKLDLACQCKYKCKVKSDYCNNHDWCDSHKGVCSSVAQGFGWDYCDDCCDSDCETQCGHCCNDDCDDGDCEDCYSGDCDCSCESCDPEDEECVECC